MRMELTRNQIALMSKVPGMVKHAQALSKKEKTGTIKVDGYFASAMTTNMAHIKSHLDAIDAFEKEELVKYNEERTKVGEKYCTKKEIEKDGKKILVPDNNRGNMTLLPENFSLWEADVIIVDEKYKDVLEKRKKYMEEKISVDIIKINYNIIPQGYYEIGEYLEPIVEHEKNGDD